MVREISIVDIDELEALIERYVNHQNEKGITLDSVKKQMTSGIIKKTHQVLMEEDTNGVAQGFLVINLDSDRLPILFANWNFEVERELLDFTFKKLSTTSSHISFESGWPTPWLTDELASYAITLGFVKYGRGYMRLEPIDKDRFSKVSIGEEFEFIPFDESMVEEISRLIFKCVNGTVDQDIWPSIYSTIPKIEQFLIKFLEGSFGIHEPFYSWVLRKKEQNIGACFLMTNENTGFLMHIVIDPGYRQRGLGKALLCYSLHSLLRVTPSVTKIELAVTMSNPAKLLYESLGFRILNESSTFVWKKKVVED